MTKLPPKEQPPFTDPTQGEIEKAIELLRGTGVYGVWKHDRFETDPKALFSRHPAPWRIGKDDRNDTAVVDAHGFKVMLSWGTHRWFGLLSEMANEYAEKRGLLLAQQRDKPLDCGRARL